MLDTSPRMLMEWNREGTFWDPLFAPEWKVKKTPAKKDAFMEAFRRMPVKISSNRSQEAVGEESSSFNFSRKRPNPFATKEGSQQFSAKLTELNTEVNSSPSPLHAESNLSQNIVSARKSNVSVDFSKNLLAIISTRPVRPVIFADAIRTAGMKHKAEHLDVEMAMGNDNSYHSIKNKRFRMNEYSQEDTLVLDSSSSTTADSCWIRPYETSTQSI